MFGLFLEIDGQHVKSILEKDWERPASIFLGWASALPARKTFLLRIRGRVADDRATSSRGQTVSENRLISLAATIVQFAKAAPDTSTSIIFPD